LLRLAIAELMMRAGQFAEPNGNVEVIATRSVRLRDTRRISGPGRLSVSVVTAAEPGISGAGPSRPPARALESAAARERAFAGVLRQLRVEAGSSGAVAAAT